MAELEIRPTAKMRLRVVLLISVGTVLSLTEMYLLFGGEANFFARRTTLTTYMADAAGVTTDSEVRVSGLRIGNVRRVELSGSLDPQKVVRVQMRVLTRYLKDIPSDSQTDVNADTVVSQKYVDIAEGKSALPIAENAVLQSKPIPLATDRADVIAAARDRLTQIDQIMAEMLSPDTRVGRFVASEDEYDKLVAGIGQFDATLHEFLSPQSPLGMIIFSPALYNGVRDFVRNLDNTLIPIQNGEGAAGHLYASDEQYNDFVRGLVDLRGDVTHAGAVLRSDDGYGNLLSLLQSANASLTAINEGEGGAGRLLTNAALYESLNGSLRSMEAMLRDLREHPKKYLRMRHKIF